MTTNTDIKPCPFCGSNAEILHQGNEYTKKRKSTVKCTGCRVQLTNATFNDDFSHIDEITVRAWNQRTIQYTCDYCNGIGVVGKFVDGKVGHVDIECPECKGVGLTAPVIQGEDCE